MALIPSTSVLFVSAAGTTPVPVVPTASDTIAGGDVGSRGLALRVITTTTATNITVLDPGATPLGNPGTPTPVALGTSAVRMIHVRPTAVNQATGLVTVTSSAQTGVTYELYRL